MGVFQHPIVYHEYHDPSGGVNQRHEILYLKLKNTEDYVVDICGGQYGYSEKVFLSGQYWRSRRCTLYESHQFGYSHKFALAV